MEAEQEMRRKLINDEHRRMTESVKCLIRMRDEKRSTTNGDVLSTSKEDGSRTSIPVFEYCPADEDSSSDSDGSTAAAVTKKPLVTEIPDDHQYWLPGSVATYDRGSTRGCGYNRDSIIHPADQSLCLKNPVSSVEDESRVSSFHEERDETVEYASNVTAIVDEDDVAINAGDSPVAADGSPKLGDAASDRGAHKRELTDIIYSTLDQKNLSPISGHDFGPAGEDLRQVFNDFGPTINKTEPFIEREQNDWFEFDESLTDDKISIESFATADSRDSYQNEAVPLRENEGSPVGTPSKTKRSNKCYIL